MGNKVKNCKLIWKREDERDSQYEKYLYIIKSSACMHSIEITEEQRLLEIERYGGYGVGTNGGGVRCGNIDVFQLKGIGVSPVVGKYTDFAHSSGIYSIDESMTEIVNSVIYEVILPVKPVKYYALFYIGSSHFIENPQYIHHSMLALRQLVTRPAHFMRAEKFKPLNINKKIINNDKSRVKESNLWLKEELGSDRSFVNLLDLMITNSAELFAFTSIHRIAHGALSPSNISIEGHWLDLTNMTFTPSNENYRASFETVSYVDEKLYFEKIIDEFAYNYSKYNDVYINTDNIKEKYRALLSQFTSYFVVSSLGIVPSGLEGLEIQTEIGLLLKDFEMSTNTKTSTLIGFPEGLNVDTYSISFIQSSFRKLFSDNNSDAYIRKIMFHFHSLQKNEKITFYKFWRSCAITAIKRNVFKNVFYNGNIRSHAKKIYSNKNFSPDVILDLNAMIGEYKGLACWLYEELDERNYILNIPNGWVFYYSMNDGVYYIENMVSGLVDCFESISGAFNALNGFKVSVINYCGLDIMPQLKAIINSISELEYIESRGANND